MATKIKIRRDTSANWNSENPVLSEGELGLETDSNKLKAGDGSTSWNSLDYLTADSSDSSTSSDSRMDVNKTTTFETDSSEIITDLRNNTVYKEEVWKYQTYPLAVKTYKSTNDGTNYSLEGESIINYTPDKKIAGQVWWDDKVSDDYQDLIKAHFHGGVPISSTTNWSNFVNSDQIDYLAESKEAMEILANSVEARGPITETVNSMNAVSSKQAARDVIGYDGILFNQIIKKEMAVGKFIAGHALLDSSTYSNIDNVLTTDTAVDEILDHEKALRVINDSPLARGIAANTSEFTIDLAYHSDALDYVLNQSEFVSSLAQVSLAAEHLIDTDFARAKVYGNITAFNIFVSNETSMGVIASLVTPSQELYQDEILLGKVLDRPKARQVAFADATFVSNFIYDDGAVTQLANHTDATSDIVNISVMMEATVYNNSAFTKFVQNSTILDQMIYSSVANNWIKQSSTAISILNGESPVTVPVLSATENKIASSFYSAQPPFYVFDNDNATWWETEGGNTTDEWVGYNFGTNVWCFQISVRCTDTSASPKDCKVQYYDNTDSTWKDATNAFTLDQQNTSDQTVEVCHSIKSSQWRLFVLNNYGSSLRIELTGLQFYCQ